ncbi:lipopolysaccharide biosynthesis protein [Pedobacter ginsengisoli]|uniref:Lipopolysaccharide biosynthesis protein n=1 Tax=Pedobacter ginsengisoli TaxID=363852 RepID=A0A2D1U4T7_9SPHI|nr:Wzz/FepE/Etk N-terminal domain-containing protein [Pedobacter ginsengisoli]ATP56621.1 lipopolysaccharide biosynthesis protein [Pedobacter ginsengisoli]
MDIKSFLRLLGKYKWVLILVPLLTGGITYFLVKNLPQQYSSEAQIATGLIDQSKQVVVNSNRNTDIFKINQQFSNIIERMKMRRIMSILSYHLILHDLEDPKASFRPYSKQVSKLGQAGIDEVIRIYKERLLNKQVIAIGDNAGKYPLYDIISSMGYDNDNIANNLKIYRPDNSDFVNVYYVSENPLLSTFLVNTLSSEFINNYGQDVNLNQNNSIELLDSLMKKKEAAMNEKNAALKDFKMKNGVLNLDKQSEMVYAQISQNEERKAQAIRDIQANQRAIADIDATLKGGIDNLSSGNSTADNRRIISLKNQLKIANSAYIDGNFTAADKNKVDSLTRLINGVSSKISDENVTNPQASRQGLIERKLSLETTISQAKGSLKSIDNELSVLKAKYNTMVPFDAGIQNYERDAELATKDYMNSLDTYNQNRTGQNVALKLQLAQLGLPGLPLASKGIIYIALSYIASLFLCFTWVLMMFLLDRSIRDSKQLAQATKSVVLGAVPYLSYPDINIRELWKSKENDPEFLSFKNLLRSLRFEISDALKKNNSKIVGITSLDSNEGKSFLSGSLAYAFAMMGEKVLLIGGETKKVMSDSKELALSQDFETFLVKREIQTEDLITILNKNDANSSLLETQSSTSLRKGFEVLKDEFDVIIIDVDGLKDLNKAKEWLLFTELNVAVFESGRSISEPQKELLSYIKGQPGFIGWVLNKVK